MLRRAIAIRLSDDRNTPCYDWNSALRGDLRGAMDTIWGTIKSFVYIGLFGLAGTR
jgi:hypothetical protein